MGINNATFLFLGGPCHNQRLTVPVTSIDRYCDVRQMSDAGVYEDFRYNKSTIVDKSGLAHVVYFDARLSVNDQDKLLLDVIDSIAELN
ncbi:hypothetical protein B4O99_14335 [Shewanella xiamenensis]|uniref:hypothetical protein n=1 Tax=Shewanella xiamenensis TaxID=332186 RepID=UPI001C500FD9|nr:hypothetical protein [Shewanella xiamenensis]MBW0280696.1 hypothetical protein [Shewanella xiamenensis]